MNDVQVPVLEAAPPTGISANDALWYKDAVIYQVNVESFFDSNADGIGDFGLTSKLEYIRDLGVNTIWLMPFYPSPSRMTAMTLPTTKTFTRNSAASTTFATCCRRRTASASR